MTREFTSWRISPAKILILLLTIGLAWGSLLIGRPAAMPPPEAGDPSPETYFATRDIVITDEAATAERQDAAAAAVETAYERDPTRVEEVRQQVQVLFGDVQAGVAPPEGAIPPVPEVPIPELTPTVPPGDEETTTTLPEPGEVSGLLFVDADGSGDYVPESGDGPLQGVDVTVVAVDGSVRRATTDALGIFRVGELPVGTVFIHIDYSTPRFPDLLAPSTGDYPELEVTPGSSVQAPDVGFAPVTEARATQEALLLQSHPRLRGTTIAKLVTLASDDVARRALAESPYLDQVEIEALRRAEDTMAREIRTAADTEALAAELYAAPRTVFFDDGTADREAAEAVSDIVATNIVLNSFPNETRTQEARDAARAAVVPVEVTFEQNQKIVDQGDIISPIQLQALDESGLLETGSAANAAALALIVALAVLLLSFYLIRFRPRLWSVGRRVALFGLLIVLAALGARVASFLAIEFEQPAIGFLIPAAAIGLMASILFDGRIALLFAVGVAAMTSLATNEIAYILFAGLAAVVPIPFASSISSRGDLRRAVAFSAVAVGVLAAPIAWLFYTGDELLQAIGYAAGAAFLNGLIGGLVAVAALSFLESIFDVTTTLRLLDLTDRNHPALQLLEERARGTFNHSLTVGTLADGAARAIGAANLLARSAAYYHDLGKTENPTFFIENQFGGFNPHNQLLPEESAQIIRQHVIDGVQLAKEYRIPTDVAEGILTHHGDGIMRYFYHKALERYPEGKVDVEDYRHMGHKPQSKEMAILMMADSVEGACRAVFAEKDPSPEAIADVVERVTGEKVSDGQLSESSLTMGELTRVKESFIDSLIGNYHQRIPYPEFPRLEEGVAGAIGPGASTGNDTEDASDSSVRSADVE